MTRRSLLGLLISVCAGRMPVMLPETVTYRLTWGPGVYPEFRTSVFHHEDKYWIWVWYQGRLFPVRRSQVVY
jgi:hypothetical protein